MMLPGTTVEREMEWVKFIAVTSSRVTPVELKSWLFKDASTVVLPSTPATEEHERVSGAVSSAAVTTDPNLHQAA
jgi:hypothetical protein